MSCESFVYDLSSKTTGNPTAGAQGDGEVSHRPEPRPQAASACGCDYALHAIEQFRDVLAEHGEIPYLLLCCVPEYGKIVDYQPDLATIVRLYECYAKEQAFGSTGRIGADLMPASPEARAVSEKIRMQAADLAGREGQCFLLIWRDPYTDRVRVAASKHYASVYIRGALLAFFRARLNEMLDLWPRDLPTDALSGGRCAACRVSRQVASAADSSRGPGGGCCHANPKDAAPDRGHNIAADGELRGRCIALWHAVG